MKNVLRIGKTKRKTEDELFAMHRENMFHICLDDCADEIAVCKTDAEKEAIIAKCRE